jgi:putative flavoprotein involved in K+ transport
MTGPIDDSEASHHGVPERREVAVIGGGQAGLALGHHLARRGLDFTILEAAGEPGAAWRRRWESLRLFTPARYSGLPGLPFPGDPDHYPTRDEVLGYLAEYVRRFELPVALNSRVRAVRAADGGYDVEFDGRSLLAEQVVIATGPFQEPAIPAAIAERLDPAVVQLHSTAYTRPADIPPGRVVVVGGGNTGYQIAEELAGSHEVHLAIGSRQTPLPQRILGRDLFRYLDATGLIRKTASSRVGRRMRERDTLIGSSPRRLQRRHGVGLHARATDGAGTSIGFEDGTRVEVGTVVWATGFRSDHSWIHVPVFGEDGRPVHRRGVTGSPGLYFLGLSWQHTRGSALLGWVGDDAEHIAAAIEERRRSARREPAPEPQEAA